MVILYGPKWSMLEVEHVPKWSMLEVEHAPKLNTPINVRSS